MRRRHVWTIQRRIRHRSRSEGSRRRETVDGWGVVELLCWDVVCSQPALLLLSLGALCYKHACRWPEAVLIIWCSSAGAPRTSIYWDRGFQKAMQLCNGRGWMITFVLCNGWGRVVWLFRVGLRALWLSVIQNINIKGEKPNANWPG